MQEVLGLLGRAFPALGQCLCPARCTRDAELSAAFPRSLPARRRCRRRCQPRCRAGSGVGRCPRSVPTRGRPGEGARRPRLRREPGAAPGGGRRTERCPGRAPSPGRCPAVPAAAPERAPGCLRCPAAPPEHRPSRRSGAGTHGPQQRTERGSGKVIPAALNSAGAAPGAPLCLSPPLPGTLFPRKSCPEEAAPDRRC